jgi:hypothetical protein
MEKEFIVRYIGDIIYPKNIYAEEFIINACGVAIFKNFKGENVFATTNFITIELKR